MAFNFLMRSQQNWLTTKQPSVYPIMYLKISKCLPAKNPPRCFSLSIDACVKLLCESVGCEDCHRLWSTVGTCILFVFSLWSRVNIKWIMPWRQNNFMHVCVDLASLFQVAEWSRHSICVCACVVCILRVYMSCASVHQVLPLCMLMQQTSTEELHYTTESFRHDLI